MLALRDVPTSLFIPARRQRPDVLVHHVVNHGLHLLPGRHDIAHVLSILLSRRGGIVFDPLDTVRSIGPVDRSNQGCA
jgi:hypothetical protein